MTEKQRDDLITELTLYNPTQIQNFLHEYQQVLKRKNSNFQLYEFLKEKFGIRSHWEKVGLV